MSAMAIPAGKMLFATLGGGAAMGGMGAAAAGGLFGGGGMGILGTVLGGVSNGLMARAEHRAMMERDEADMQRRRDNYAGAADGIAAGQGQLDGASPTGTGFSQVMQRADANSNANLRVGQREQPSSNGFSGMLEQTRATPSAPTVPRPGPTVPRPGARARYDARSGQIQYV